MGSIQVSEDVHQCRLTGVVKCKFRVLRSLVCELQPADVVGVCVEIMSYYILHFIFYKS